MYSDRSRVETAEMAVDLERLDHALLAAFPALACPRSERTVVYAFKRRSSYSHYVTSSRSVGSCVFETSRGVIATDAGGSSLIEALAHELAHDRLMRSVPRCPLWMNEGFALLFETAGMEAKFRIIRSWEPRFQDALERIERDPRLWSTGTDRLFQIQNEDSLSDGTVALFQVTSWALVRELYYQHWLPGLLKSVRSEGPSGWTTAPGLRGNERATTLEEARRHALGIDRVESPFPVGRSPVSVRSGAMPPARMAFELGRLVIAQRGWTPGRRDIERHFREAIALDSREAAAIAGLGQLADRGGRAVRADSLYAIAVALAPQDPVAWSMAAQGTLFRFLDRPITRSPAMLWGWDDPGSAAVLARERFARCLEIAPDHLASLAGHAYTCVWSPNPPDSAVVPEMRRAMVFGPSNPELAQLLALALVRAGRLSEADSVIAVCRPALSVEDGKRLSDWACSGAIVYGSRAESERDFTRARAAFAWVAARALDPGTRGHAARRVKAMQHGRAVKIDPTYYYPQDHPEGVIELARLILSH